MKEIHKHYTETYFKSEERDVSPLRFRDAILLLPSVKGMLVLDAGCGTGELTKLLMKEGAEVIAVDFAKYAVKKTKQETGQQTVQASVTHLPFRSNTFEAAMLLEVIEHLPYEACMRALNEIRRTIKQHTYFIVSTTPNKLLTLGGIGIKFYHKISKRNMKFNLHISFFTPWSLRRFLEIAGFSSIEIYCHNFPGRFPFVSVIINKFLNSKPISSSPINLIGISILTKAVKC